MKYKLEEVIEFNPRESIKKGTFAKKVSMDKLLPFNRNVIGYELTEYNGGVKFKNDDVVMARITPCLENGKTCKINILNENEIGFGSTEYIIWRAKKDLMDSDFIYYLTCSPYIRDIAIKSMVGTSGRQRVQLDVLKSVEYDFPSYEDQIKIGKILKNIDDKIALNNRVNDNLAA